VERAGIFLAGGFGKNFVHDAGEIFEKFFEIFSLREKIFRKEI